jgi:hypothetical protein
LPWPYISCVLTKSEFHSSTILVWGEFHRPKNVFCSAYPSFPYLNSWEPLMFLLFSWFFFFQNSNILV